MKGDVSVHDFFFARRANRHMHACRNGKKKKSNQGHRGEIYTQKPHVYQPSHPNIYTQNSHTHLHSLSITACCLLVQRPQAVGTSQGVSSSSHTSHTSSSSFSQPGLRVGDLCLLPLLPSSSLPYNFSVRRAWKYRQAWLSTTLAGRAW